MKLVSPKDLKQWMDCGSVVLIDVREPEEYKKAHIPGSILIPLGTLTLADILGFGDRKIVFHCQAGRRSGNACEAVTKQNPSLDVYTMDGGLNAWAECGFEVIRA